MKKLLTYVSFLLLTISCNTNKTVVASVPTAPAVNSEKAVMQPEAPRQEVLNSAKENNTVAKPVVLKRTMRKPAVI